MFLAYSFDQGKRYATLLNYLVALNYNFQIRSLPSCNNSFVLKFFLQGVKNLSPQSAALLPITALEKIVNSSYDKKLLKAMFVIVYFCCLRIGEVGFRAAAII